MSSSTPPEYIERIKAGLGNCLTETDFDFGSKYVGKTRDTYTLDDKLILITTDRHTSFDRRLTDVPFKGQVLNQTSAWWFEQTKGIVPNHVVSVPDPNVTVGLKCTTIPVEFVVRDYITGSTGTAIWTHYQKGVRDFCGNKLPDGLVKNKKLPETIVTPSTKDESDESISGQEAVRRGLLSEDDWEETREAVLKLFARGRELAAKRGLILVDTKYELGRDATGQLRVIDEMHTPDSSRYWVAATYEQRFAAGEEPEYFDKEFLRLWFAENSDPYNDVTLPPAPEELVIELARRYIQLFETITGTKFSFPDENQPIDERILANLKAAV